MKFIDLKSVLNKSAVLLCFEFSSDGAMTDEGFYIDDLEVVTSNAAFMTLPVLILYVKAVKSGKEVLIRWESEIDSSYRYFEVERSKDGQSFTSFFQTADRHRVLYNTEPHPHSGMTYYCIKSVGSEGVLYSQVTSVKVGHQTAVVLYPNPATEQLQLEFNGLTDGRYYVQIVDQTGQIISQREFLLRSDREKINLPINGLRTSSFQLCVCNDRGELLEVKRFVKL